jgi:hypothetical protein
MSNELAYTDHTLTGLTTYYAVLQQGATIVKASDGSSLALSSANWQSAAIALSDTGHPGHYLASVPSGTAAGRYKWRVYQASGTPSSTAAITDEEISGEDAVDWDGTAEVGLNDAAKTADLNNVSTDLSTLIGTSSEVQTAVGEVQAAIGTPTATLADDIAAIPSAQAIADAVETAVGNNTGPGADEVTLNWTNSTTGLPVADGDVWVTSDEAGTNVVAGTLQTDSEGNVTFLLDAGNTYYAWFQKDGVNPIRAQEFEAVAD